MMKAAALRVGSFPFLPILVALIMPLQLTRTNPDLFSGEASLMRIVAFGVLVATTLTVALWGIVRDKNLAGVLAAILMALLVFGAEHAKLGADFVELKAGFRMPPSTIIVAVFAVAAILLAKARTPSAITHAGNAATAVLLTYNAGLLWLAVPSTLEPAHTVTAETFSDTTAGQDSPDIIHVLLDGYSRADVLSEIYGHDNMPFLSNLEEMGFSIADQATAPYNQTLLTTHSIFSGNYLDPTSVGTETSPIRYRSQVAASFRANTVMSALSSVGYKMVASKSEYTPLSLEGTPMAAANQGFSMTFLERTLFEFSAFSLIVDDLGLSEMLNSSSASTIRSTLRTALDENGEAPHFYFLHILAPHPPFDIDSEGRTISTVGIFNKLADGSHFHFNTPEKREAYRLGYVAKLTFVNNEMLSFLRKVVADRDRPLVILIHGDHGGGMHLDQGSITNTCLRERFSPLLAVYSSDGKLQEQLPPDINLVNLYRIVFNTYFGSNYELLPNKSIYATIDDPATQISFEPEELLLPCDKTP